MYLVVLYWLLCGIISDNYCIIILRYSMYLTVLYRLLSSFIYDNNYMIILGI